VIPNAIVFSSALAFAPSIIRLGVWLVRPRQPLGGHTPGFMELLQGHLFNILLVGALLIAVKPCNPIM
jgi:hypothetical protein